MGAFYGGGRENSQEAKKNKKETHILLSGSVVQGVGCIGRSVLGKMREEVKDNREFAGDGKWVYWHWGCLGDRIRHVRGD